MAALSSTLPSSPLRRSSASRHPHPHLAVVVSSASVSWQRPFLRFLLFFLVGFLLGLSPLSFPLPAISVPFPPLTFTPSSSNPNPGTSSASNSGASPSPNPLLLIITPTYSRSAQAYYLHRLAQTLTLVPPPLLWIVVESGKVSSDTSELLRRCGVVYRHISSGSNSSLTNDHAGVHKRNAALEHIEIHRLNGIVYFADEDNIYSLDVFNKLRDIVNFGTWPVAMLSQNSKGKVALEGPVCSGRQVIGWHTNEKIRRLQRFHADMSGFAFNSTMLWNPTKRIHQAWNTIRQLDTAKEGFQETTFIEQLVEDESQMEGTPYNCSAILNWRLHLVLINLEHPMGWKLLRNLDAVIPLK